MSPGHAPTPTPAPTPAAAPTLALARLLNAIAEDLRQLAALHDRELDSDLLAAAHAACFPGGLGLVLESELACQAAQVVGLALSDLDASPDAAEFDNLAADYAAIYLNHGLQASPFESTWLDEEGLQMQAPMFQVRDWYRRYGLASPDWRRRADDHLSLQLSFTARLLDLATDENGKRPGHNALSDAADFLDEHLLRWLPSFGQRVATHAATPFYAGLAMLTAAYTEELRQLLEQLLDQPRPTADAIEQRMKPKVPETRLDPPGPYVPGNAPTW